MNVFVFIFLGCVIICENPFTQEASIANPFAINQDDVDEIKRTGLWTPMTVSENLFQGWTIKQIKKLCGLNRSIQDKLFTSTNNNDEELKATIVQAVPTSFDGRTAWGKCLAPVKDQGNCGSCWAFAAGDTLGDTRCIHKKLTKYVQLSQQDLVSCDTRDYGCDGGNYPPAFYYLTKTGIVTDSCFPYTSGVNGVVPKCPTKCVSTTETWVKYKCNSRYYNYGNNISGMKTWLTTNGPMSVRISVYKDFLSYKSGIYTKISKTYLGEHAVKLVGYGVSGSTSYWICQNSWGTSWGMKGFFYIKERHVNIDSEAYACNPWN